MKMNELVFRKEDCVVLRLILTGEWYRMIDTGGKREEYRRLCAHYTSRIENFSRRFVESDDKRPIVAFSLGYAKPTMWFEIEQIGIRSHRMAPKHPEWGETQIDRYVISLGTRVTLID